VTGGSYGGLMTAWIVGHTDRFACALSARGVYNFMSFNGTTDIPAFNTDKMGVDIWNDPMKLWEWSPLAYAHQIKTPLLIKHADNDYRVPIEQAEQLYAAVRRTGGTVEFIRYPREGHELSRSGEPEHRLSRYQVMMDWFDRYCK
jgi:dipeptidyl aminopeptidase/acylaminoacyl peptidase